MNILLSLTITLAPLVFGLVAWGLSGSCAIFWRVLSQKKRAFFPTLSWVFCAIALWFPLQAIHRWVENEDTAAILDCTGAYFLCAGILLIGNLLLTALGWLRSVTK